MDEFSALLGLGIDDADQTQALADSLRGRKRAADFFALSTVGNIAKGAQAEQENVLAGAKQGGVLRRALQDRASQDERSRLQRELTASEGIARRTAQAEQSELGRASTAETARLGREGQDERMRFAADQVAPTVYQTPDGETIQGYMRGGQNVDSAGVPIDPSATEYKAPTSATLGLGASPGYKSVKERDKFEDTAKELRSMQTMTGSFDPEYATPVEGVPAVGSLTNTMARYGLGTPNREKAANWWGLYDKSVNIPERHEAFGAALTATEKPLWEAATITPNMKAEYVQVRLKVKERLMRRKAEEEAIQALRSGRYTKEDVAYEYEDVLPNFDQLVELAGDRDAYQSYREREAEEMAGWLDEEGGIEPPATGLTQTEQTRMEELRAKRDAQR